MYRNLCKNIRNLNPYVVRQMAAICDSMAFISLAAVILPLSMAFIHFAVIVVLHKHSTCLLCSTFLARYDSFVFPQLWPRKGIPVESVGGQRLHGCYDAHICNTFIIQSGVAKLFLLERLFTAGQ